MQSDYNTHIKRIVLLLVVAAVLGFLAKKFATPTSFGKYGHYRADAIQDEVDRPLRHMTNESCLSCHPFEWELHEQGRHKTISCEFCHGTYADHVQDGKFAGRLPVKKGEEIKTLCLRCHNKAIKARPKDVIKTVEMPRHLEDQHVQVTHICNQCHHVHAPLIYINHAQKVLGIEEANNGKQ
ncbi:MAG TPA: hypothetical protein EYP57_00400 [Thermodesulfobacteriaceae bacterium]|nr:hypothetical protein [Thermodesulfobacteriaceae bacterium]